MTTPSINHRANKNLQKKMQEGTILSFTTIQHPPAGFDKSPRTIALIELENGTKILAPLLIKDTKLLTIGAQVAPRMRLQRVNNQGLRIYDISYRVLSRKQVTNTEKQSAFPGYIIALTGPSGVGKSTICSRLATISSEFTAKVPILTTRDPKEGDEDEYRYISQEKFTQMKRNKEIIASTQIPSSTETRWYGYCKKDIEAIWEQGKIPIVITETNLLQGLSRYFGRRSILSLGLLPPGNSKRTMLSHLLHRLRSRGRDSEKSIRDRIENAKDDLQFFEDRKELFDHLVINKDLGEALDLINGHVLEYAKS